MKYRAFLLYLFIILIITLGTTSDVIAAKYEVGIEDKSSLIWKCNVYNKEKMDEIFGMDWDIGAGFFKNMEEGARMKWKIQKIENNIKTYSERIKRDEEALGITYDVWSWTKDEEWGNKNYKEQSIFFKNPNHYPEHYLFLDYAPLWFPVPTSEYLKALKPNLYAGYTVDVTFLLTFTCEVEKGDKEGGNPSEYVKILAIYNPQGILTSYKLYITNHYVMIDVSLDSQFIYQFPVFIALLVIFSVGLICIYKKI